MGEVHPITRDHTMIETHVHETLQACRYIDRET